jgi:hypothetical protein
MLAYPTRRSGAKWAQTVIGFTSVGRENLNNRKSPILGPQHPARLGEPTNTPVRSPQHTASCCSCCLMHARAPGTGDAVPNGRERGPGGGSVGRENLKISPNPDFWARGTPHGSVNPQTRPCDHRNTRLVVAVAVLMHARAPGTGDAVPNGRERGSVAGQSVAKI